LRRFFAVLSAAIVVFAWAFEGSSQEGSEAARLVEVARSMRASGRVRFDFKDLDMVTFIRFMSELLGENYVLDPRVKGTVTVLSPREVNLEEARSIFLSVLSINGWGLENYGSYFKVVPAKEVKVGATEVGVGRDLPRPGEELLTHVVPLVYLDPKEASRVCQVALSSVGVITPVAGTNAVLVRDLATHVDKVIRMIRAMDAPGTVKQLRIVRLSNASASSLAKRLDGVFKAKGGIYAESLFVPDERTNSLLVVVSPNLMEETLKVISAMDAKAPPTTSNVRIRKLRYANAEELVPQVEAVAQTMIKLMPPEGVQGAEVKVVADKSTNSLVFTCPPDLYEQLSRVIDELDVQKRQVMIEAFIAEVNVTKLKHVGIDWATWFGKVLGDVAYVLGGEFGTAVDPNVLRTVRGGTNAGALLYGYIKSIEQHDALNVLSVPRILCTDNQTSRFQVGKVIPVLKSSTADKSNPSAVEKVYDYKETGIILEVTPRIRSENHIDLDITQVVEDVLTATTADTPVTSKREIKTTVQVQNGQTVVLGGLMKEAEKLLRKKVPGLAVVPIIGEFFRTVAREREKVDLLILLTPYILTSPADVERKTEELTSVDEVASSDEVEMKLRGWLKQVESRRK